MATPQEIVTDSICFGACIPDKWAALLWQFDQIRINGGGSVMTTQEIVGASKCFGNCIPDKWAVLLYLSSAIVDNGGGGGGGDLTYTRSALDPVGAPPTTYGIHWNTDTLQMFNWTGSVWI